MKKSLPTVVTVTPPVNGAVQAHQTEPDAVAPTCAGSPGSAVAKMLVPSERMSAPLMLVALAKLSAPGGSGSTESARTALPDPALFVAVRATCDTASSVGVPEMMPVTGSSIRPGGRPVAPKEVGEFVAVS